MAYEGEHASRLARAELATKLQRFIARSGKTQRQIAEEIDVEESYVSKMAGGTVGWVNSRKYFAPLVRALGLSPEEVKEIKPDAVVEFKAPPAPASDPDPPVPMLPDELLEASRLYGDTTPALKNPHILQQLAAVRHWDGGPRTPQDWLDFYIDNRRRFREN